MTDDLFKEHEKYNFGEYDKIILWMPTFRQSDYLNYNDSGLDDVSSNDDMMKAVFISYIDYNNVIIITCTLHCL